MIKLLMRTGLAIIGTMIFSSMATAQNLKAEMIYPDTLRATTDSFYVTSIEWDDVWPQLIDKNDTLNLGTYGFRGVDFTIWTDIDTIHIPHVNFPYRQLIKIPVVSKTDTTLCILRFQAANSAYNDQYVNSARGEYAIDIPEMYELANIALYLSSCAEYTGNYPSTDYTQKVNSYFNAYRNHTLIQVLNTNCRGEESWDTYYGFRENSMCFGFDESDKIHYDEPYKYVLWDNASMYGGQFRNLLYLVQDFVDKSNFRQFYNDNKKYYNELIGRENELLPVRQMWSWLEKEFPQRYDSYRIIFSPLIEGSHSTQQFHSGSFTYPKFTECVMFINSSEAIDDTDLAEKLKEGLRSGIIFTEIDHNYVNPTTEENFDAVKVLIDNKDDWATVAAQRGYRNEFSIFNEYMTHALFCLYAHEVYDEEVSREIIKKRILLMNNRGFIKFEDFNTTFMAVMEQSKKTVYESYAEIISQMQTIKNK